MSDPPEADEPAAAPGRPGAAGHAPDQAGDATAVDHPAPPAQTGDAPLDGPAPDTGDAASRDWAVEEVARRARAERAIRGTLSGALILEAIMVLFVPRAIAPLADDGLTGGRLAFLLGLSGALIVASVLQRRRIGPVLGTVLQLPVIAAGFLVGAMFVLGLVFAGVWLYLLRVRQDLLRPARPPAAS